MTKCWGYQHVGIDLKTLKFALPPMRMLKFALPQAPPPMQAGGVGSSTKGAGVGHVYFHVVCLVFGCVGYPTQTRYPVEYRL